ncbi:MAG: alpha-L-fucosidase [Gemmatimonadota bacterium]
MTAGELQAVARRAAAVKPTPQQRAWQELEQIAFAHFGVNTFTDREWGDGREDPAVFDPAALDADQWVDACRQGGMGLLILTAKHHDGFCLWPSDLARHSVAASPWRQGKGDVVGEVARACRAGGLKLGLYCSPWDRHEASYGTDQYNDFFTGQLRELLTRYGEVTEVWFDGACGEGPNGRRQVYDWPRYYETVRQLQPDAVIAICGPDVRWVGNESGLAREDEWSVLPTPEAERPEVAPNFQGHDAQAKDLGSLERLAGAERLVWYPAECDVSIRPGWFYHASQDLQVRSMESLLDIYYRSVGRNSVLLLNVPPDQRGLFHENDVERLGQWRAALERTFGRDLARGARATATSSAPGSDPRLAVDGRRDTWWQAPPEQTSAVLELDLGEPQLFDRLELAEPIQQGQRLDGFRLEAWHGGQWKPVAAARAVGYRRLDRFGAVRARRVRLAIEAARAEPALTTFALYQSTP